MIYNGKFYKNDLQDDWRFDFGMFKYSKIKDVAVVNIDYLYFVFTNVTNLPSEIFYIIKDLLERSESYKDRMARFDKYESISIEEYSRLFNKKYLIGPSFMVKVTNVKEEKGKYDSGKERYVYGIMLKYNNKKLPYKFDKGIYIIKGKISEYEIADYEETSEEEYVKCFKKLARKIIGTDELDNIDEEEEKKNE